MVEENPMPEDNKVKTSECIAGDIVYTNFAGLSQNYEPRDCAFFHLFKWKVILPEYSLCARIQDNGSFDEKPVIMEECYKTKKEALFACAQRLQSFVDNISGTINKALEQAMLIIDKE
jgi:hypothetical protein